MISNQFDSAPAPPRFHFSTLGQLTFSVVNEDRVIRVVLVAFQRARTLVRGVGEVNRIMPGLLMPPKGFLAAQLLLAPPPHRGRDAHAFPVLGHRAPRDLDSCFL